MNRITNKIDAQMAKIKAEERIGLMTHVVVGYPSLEETVSTIETMAKAGVDFVELQIPFSDPLADGPTIQHACETALAQGTKVADAFTAAKELSQKVDIPLLFMGYFNTVLQYGVEKFCADAAKVGIAGLIIPDVPLEAAKHEGFLAACEKHGLHNIITLSPASTDERLQKNAPIASGFAYCMARQGITGVQDTLDPRTAQYLKRVKRHITTPLAVGFGISQPAHIQALKGHADVAVIGSAIINILRDTLKENRQKAVKSFLEQLR